MALSPSYLDNCPAAAVALWQECEDEILKDMARRIQKTDFFTPATLWQQNRLQTASKTKQEIVKTLAKYTGYSQAVIKQMMLDAGNISIKQDLNVISQADIYKSSKIDKAALNAVLRSGAAQTNQTMQNICKTMAVTATKQFEKALDNAWMQVASGAFDINTAIDRACKSLADSGITAIDYGKRKDTIETAVRRAVRTGVNQTSLKITEELCNEVGCDLVEVSAHDGARPDHSVWQGQIYSRSGNSKKYPSFSKTGYGTGAGLGGWNCRHSFGPYVEGGNRIWDDQQLEDYKAKKYSYNGQDLTTYEATQYQRALERDLRKAKREQIAGVDGAQYKMDIANARLNDFCETTGLKRQYSNENVYGWSGKLGKPTKAVKKKAAQTFTSAKDKLQNQIDSIQNSMQAMNKVYSGIWKDDVSLADYEAKKDAIPKKQAYYNQQISKNQAKQALYNPSDADYIKLQKQIDQFQQYLDDLDEFEKLGKQYADLMHQLDQLQNSMLQYSVKPSATGFFGPDAYTQTRKDAALWAKNTKQADNMLRDTCGDVWQNASKVEKDSIYEYTRSYHKFNEPLRGIEYGTNRYLGVGNTDLNAGSTRNGKFLNAMTSIIEKSVYDDDIWLQRGCGYSGMDKFFQCDASLLRYGTQAQLEAEFLGKEVTEYGFMSCGVAKGKGFGGNIILNVYAPKGTKMMYAEPFSAFGNGGGRSWDGKAKQGTFGYESEIILQQGTRFRIVKVERTPNMLYFDIEVVEQLAPQMWAP